jgi:hypothetical protein
VRENKVNRKKREERRGRGGGRKIEKRGIGVEG